MVFISRSIVVVLVAWGVVIGWQVRSNASNDSGGVRAPALLSQTGLYLAGATLVVDPANRPFSPQYPLWTDGASKRRWVYLPDGATIDGRDETRWIMPVGIKFWKEFSFDGRKVETRLLWRASAERWVVASYIWNEGGTEAELAPDRGIVSDADVGNGKRHVIPPTADCLTCHGSQPGPLGFTALQLSPDRDPGAIHGEAPTANLLTLEQLVGTRTLSGARADILSRPPRIMTADPKTRTVLGYLTANCGTCHNGRGEIAALGPTLRIDDLMTSGDAVANTLLTQRTTWRVPNAPQGGSLVIDVDNPENSAMLVRMRSRRPSSQMPPLGTVMRDEKAIATIAEWVAARGH
jgi:hypothetical protein